jgi:hypothetical protein
MEKTKFKIGDIVYWQELQGKVIMSYNITYPIRVRFTNNRIDDFTIDGRICIDTPPVLSHTPYTLNGFTQNEVIEKDTLVFVKDAKCMNWEIRFYSHFKDGKHYCFKYQHSSKETSDTDDWTYLETENPLIKQKTW